MNIVGLEHLRSWANMCFAEDTAHEGSYDPRNPVAGHCAVMAAMVCGVFGGDIITCKVGDVPHWYNHLLWGKDRYFVDVTGDQFGRDSIQMSADRLYAGRHVYRKKLGGGVQARGEIFRQRLLHLKEDLSHGVDTQFFTLAQALSTTSFGGMTEAVGMEKMAGVVYKYAEQGRLPFFCTFANAIIHPYTHYLYLIAIVRLSWPFRSEMYGWQDMLDRVVNELRARGLPPHECLRGIYEEYYKI